MLTFDAATVGSTVVSLAVPVAASVAFVSATSDEFPCKESGFGLGGDLVVKGAKVNQTL